MFYAAVTPFFLGQIRTGDARVWARDDAERALLLPLKQVYRCIELGSSDGLPLPWQGPPDHLLGDSRWRIRGAKRHSSPAATPKSHIGSVDRTRAVRAPTDALAVKAL